MQFVFQLPIIDLRQVKQPGETVNVWPLADMTKEQVDTLMKKNPFIRNFGKIESSPDGYSCSINCINSDKLLGNGFTLNDKMVPVFNSYKRLYADGTYTTKAEFGFSDRLESTIKNNVPEEPVYISDVLSHYLSMPVDVQDLSAADKPGDNNNANYWRTIKLSELGQMLTGNYFRATAKNKGQPGNQEYVVSGEACVTLTFVADDKIILPVNAEKLDEFTIDGNKVQLHGYKLNFDELTFKVWLFQLPALELLTYPTVNRELQNRRSHLFRLNAEKETMRILVNGFDPKNADAGVKKYIKKTPIKINRKKRFSTRQDAVRNFALQSEKDNVKFATLQDIKKALDDFASANLENLAQKMKAGPKKKSILFITSNPTDSNTIDFGEQLKEIDEALQRGSEREYFDQPKIKTGVERDKVMEILYKNEPDFLHITLHNSEVKGLYFQDAAKNPDPMTVEEFAEYIKTLNTQKKPEAVILCACNTLGHATAVKQYCNYAIGTNFVFPEDAAVVYANKFYTALFSGKKVDFCHDVGVKGIRFNKPPFKVKDGPEVYTILQLLSSS